MRTLKNIIVGLVVIIVLLIVISLSLPSKVHVERSKIIHAQPAIVFNEVNNFKNWNNWLPWNQVDPKMQITYGNISEGAGATYEWNSDNDKVGKGKIKITNSTPNDSIGTSMDFMEHGTAYGKFKFQPAESGTKMTWSMESDMGWNPIAKIFGVLMMDKMVGTDFEKGLKNIDSVVTHAKVVSTAFDIQLTTVTAMPALTIKDSVPAKDISSKYMKLMGDLHAYAAKSKLEQQGSPFCIFYSYTPEKTVMEPGIATNKMGKSNGSIIAKNTPEGNAVKLKYYGAYSKMDAAYAGITQWIKDNKKTIAGPSWEVYVSGPGMEKDTAKWLTEIYFPVE